MDQIFVLQQVFGKSLEYAKEVYTCFIDLVKTYDRVPRDKLWAVLLRGQLLATIKPLYKQSEVCVHVNGIKTKPFSVSVGLRQGCVLSPLLFKYMYKINRNSSSSSSITFEECNVWHLLFADDFALLSSNKSGLQDARDWYSDPCLDAGMKINTAKTGIKCFSRHPFQCSFQINGITSSILRSLSILESHPRVMVDRTTNWTHAMEKQMQ